MITLCILRRLQSSESDFLVREIDSLIVRFLRVIKYSRYKCQKTVLYYLYLGCSIYLSKAVVVISNIFIFEWFIGLEKRCVTNIVYQTTVDFIPSITLEQRKYKCIGNRACDTSTNHIGREGVGCSPHQISTIQVFISHARCQAISFALDPPGGLQLMHSTVPSSKG